MYPLKFPLRMGLSGHVFENSIDIIALNEPRKDKYFQPEIDNTSSSPAVRNIAIGTSVLLHDSDHAISALLRNEYGDRVGVLQVVNKSSGKDITEADEVALYGDVVITWVMLGSY